MTGSKTDISNADAPLHVELGARSYDIVIGQGLIADAGGRIGALMTGSRAVIVTDDNVGPLYLPRLQESLSAAAIQHASITVPAGEKTKDFNHLQKLTDELLAARIDRSTLLIALGGGVIGDLAGFAAAITMRGIDFVQVPTTLLAQVDSSVGGKTGINSARGKNLIGAFHQPRLVLADLECLDSLPRRQLLAGYAEIIKYGLINDPQFFDWLEINGGAVTDGDKAAQHHAVLTSCAAKAAIVAADERESGVRALLNLGHTFGHALEAETGYDGTLLHGEVVAMGMTLAYDFSQTLGLCSGRDCERVRSHLNAIGLPTKLGDLAAASSTAGWTADALITHMALDKKAENGKMVFVLARAIGDCFINRDVSIDQLRAFLTNALTEKN